MADEATPVQEPRALAQEALLEFWGLDVSLIPTSIGVNRQVWQADGTFLVGAWPDEQRAVGRELELCQALNDNDLVGFETPLPIPSRDGRTVVEFRGRIWWRTREVKGVHPDPKDESQVRAVAQALGQLHRQLSASGETRRVQPRQFDEWPALADRFLDDHSDLLPPDDRDVVRQAANVVRKNIRLLHEDQQLVHGDPSFPNIQCESTDSGIVVTGFLDWQEAAVDTTLTDLSVLGNTIWQRSGVAVPRDLLEQALVDYRGEGGRAWAIEEVLVAMLTAKLQSVAHHGHRYVQGKGALEHLTEQPTLIGQILSVR